MNFENNPIADRVEKQMRSLQKSGVKLNAGSEYNRVFEAFYDLFKRLDESEPSPVEDVQRMAEQTIKEIAGIAWKGAANAFRMYPENKHTFFGYWDAAKNQFAGYSAHPPAPAGMEEAVMSIVPTDLRIKEKAEEFINEYASDFPPGNATCFAAGAKWMKDILINK